MTTQKPSTSSSTSEKGWNYDVFMSFRGEDTRKTFSGHLYEALNREGIHTFIDDEKLESGMEISVELVKAIEESKISIVVLSEEYASSTWCLHELVKILECRKTKGQKVVPIFYKVDPSEVRKQRGSFGRALARHEEDGRIENVQRWKEALTEIAGLSGYDLRNGSEVKLIKLVVGFISRQLIWDHTSLSVAEHPVGIDSRGEEVISLLGVGGTSNDVRIIGIWGVGGIGKTTIAKGVYNQLVGHFEGGTFLENVRESSKTDNGLVHLQRRLLSEILQNPTLDINNIDRGVNVIKQRLCNKRVLVILDDVGHGKQLEKLVGEPNWFGLGSRIIITTRDEGLLQARYGINYKIYHVKKLNNDEALELFSWNAFKKNHPKSGFLRLSKKVVNHAGGLPLALKILGSLLRERSTDEWISELDKLQRIPNNEIQEILKVSFDGLDRMQKDIFLDVAFFFKGKNINYATKILESFYDFHPAIDLKVLTERSLIMRNSNNKLGMHDLLQEMGWEIVCQESPEEPGKRSRLSFHKDVHRVLTKNTGTEVVKGIILKPEEVHFSIEALERMNALKLLEVRDAHICKGFEYFCRKDGHPNHKEFAQVNNVRVFKDSNMHPSEDFNYLSNELRCLKWPRYPSKSMPSSFHPTDLVELDLPYSRIEQLWKTKTCTLKLEFLNLSHSRYLTKTPDLSAFPRLEILILEGCTRLVEVHPSSLVLNRLVYLNLKDCKSLRRLWEGIELKSLKNLILSGCSKLENLPKIRGTMEHLWMVYLDGTGIKELPSSIEHLTGLVYLNLANCKNLASLPSSIDKLKSLKNLILSGCSKLENLPKIRGTMERLWGVYLDGTGIKELPSSIEHLTGLVNLNLANCKNLASLPSSIDKLKSLQTLNVSGCSKLDELPSSIGRLEKLKTLSFKGCKNLASPLSLLLPSSLSGLSSLTKLNVSGCNLSDGAIPGAISCLSTLRKLNLSRNNFVSPPEGLNRLDRLKLIKFENCTLLRELPLLPTSIWRISAHGCRSLEKLPHPSYLENLDNPHVNFSNCQKLNKVFLPLPLSPYKDFELVIPGSETPEWFEHKSTGSSISFEMSPLEFSKFRGVGLCAVFTLMEKPLDADVHITCILSDVNGRKSNRPHFRIPGKRYTESDHVWMRFCEIKSLVNRKISRISSDGLYHFEASFEASHLAIKKCGVHIFYWEEEEIKHNIMFDDSVSDQSSYYYSFSGEGEGEEEEEEIEEEEEVEEEEIKHNIMFDDSDSDQSSYYYSPGEGEEEVEEERSGSEWSNKWLSLLNFFCPCFKFDKEPSRASHILCPNSGDEGDNCLPE